MADQPVDRVRLRHLRDSVLRYIYEHGAGAPNFDVPATQIQAALGISREELRFVATLLRNQGLTASGQYDCIGLNSAGQHEAESLGPDVPMRDPPPSPNTNIIVGDVSNSTVQMAGGHSSQTAATSNDYRQAIEILNEIERRLPDLELDEKSRSNATSLISALRNGVRDAVSSAPNQALAVALNAILAPVASNLGNALLQIVGAG